MAASRPNEDGFILIGALWLLILCGAIVAMLMLRSQANASAVADSGKILNQDLALDAGLQTIIADILLGGSQSEWARVPAEGNISVGDAVLKVRVTTELGRLDANEAEPKAIETALQALGIPAARRAVMTQSLLAARDPDRRIKSWAELRRQLQDEDAGSGPCLEEYFTIYSGLALPQGSHVLAELAPILGPSSSEQQGQPAPAGPAAPLRIELSSNEGGSVTAWVRILGLQQRPYEILNYMRSLTCR